MSNATYKTLAPHLRRVLELDPSAVAIEAGDRRYTWGDLATAAHTISNLLDEAGVPKESPVGWFAHNRPASVASFVGLLLCDRMIVPLRPRQSPAAIRDELVSQNLCAIIGQTEDWRVDAITVTAGEIGSLAIAVDDSTALRVSAVSGLTKIGAGPHRPSQPGVVLERLTSGTTGPPKRIPVGEDVLIPALLAGAQSTSSDDAQSLRLKKSPAILLKPFSHAGGLFGLLLTLYQARPMVLIDRFDPEEWANIVQRYQPKSASLVPAMIRMILDARIPREKLLSLKAIRSGTAPLDPETQIEFESCYGVPVLVDYGAAEFIGGIAGWTLEDHKKYSKTKTGSVGRPRRDVELRLRSAETGEDVPTGEIGVLHLRGPRFGDDWHRTNDLALVDADGFLFLKGRADDAINRGGFKILPDDVASVLRRYPGVRDAAVIGKPDSRLGEVPVAALELAPGTVPPTEDDLHAFSRKHLAAYMVPVEFKVVEELPRTASMKVSRPLLKSLLRI